MPHDNMADLIFEIKRSLHSSGLASSLVWGKLPEWAATTRLEAWCEFNWRMERALVPLRPEFVIKIEEVLEEVGDCGYSCEQWLALAIAVLRHYREFRDDVKFQDWHKRLSDWDGNWDEVHHHRSYQFSLWHLTRLDDVTALESAQAWRAERGGDPYWQARKAGILAELGKHDEAQLQLDECFRRLQGCNTNAAPYFVTSRESAVLNIKAAQFIWGLGDREKRERTNRLRVLSNIDGWDYWRELSVLGRPDQEFREKWESGDYDRSRYLWEPLAAVQCFRFSEELGEPLIFRKSGVCCTSSIANALGDSFTDLALANGCLAGTSLLRLRHEKFWHKRIDPAHIARLPDDLLGHMWEACENAFQQLENSYDRSDSAQVAYLLRVLRWRLDGDQRQKWFKRLLSLGKREAVQSNRLLAGDLKKVIEELATDFSPAQVMDILSEALDFPLPSEVEMDVISWPNPFRLQIPNCLEGHLSERALARIEVLVSRAPTDQEALLRLVYLGAAKILPKEVAPKLATKIWVDGNLDIPDFLHFPLLLSLPEPVPGRAQEAIADHFVKNPPPSFRASDGKVTFGGYEWFRSLYYASKPYRHPNAPYVTWTVAQAEDLLSYTEAWWCKEGKQLFAEFKEQQFPFMDGLDNRLYWLRSCLARAIAPAIPKESDVGRLRLRQLISDFEDSGYSMLSALPLLLRFDVYDDNAVAERLILGIRSHKAEIVSDALWGIIHWCEFRKSADLPPVPHRLIEQLMIFLAARAEGNNAADVVATVEAILDHDRSILSPRAIELMELALDALQARAAYPETWHQRDAQRYVNTVSLRQNAVSLASAVHRAGISTHEAIEYWLEVGSTDPLPIVQQAMRV